MGSAVERFRPSIRTALVLIVLVVVLLTTAIFTGLLLESRRSNIVASADARLTMAAEFAREIIGHDYHDGLLDETSVSGPEFARIVAKNDDICRRLGLQYLWSVLVLDDRIVFTSATHSHLDDPRSPCASFFEAHRDPLSFGSAIKSGATPSFSTFHNEWGEGRQVLIPRKDSRGRTYIFGASLQLAELQSLLRRTTADAIGIGLGILGGVFLLTLLLSRLGAAPIVRLTEAADRMAAGDLDVSLQPGVTREVRSLSVSFDRMRRVLKRNMAALEEAQQEYRTLVDHSQAIIYRIAADGTLTFVSRSWELLLGHRSDEVVGHCLTYFLHEADVAIWARFLQDARETGEAHPGVEYRIFHKDGSIRRHRSVVTPVPDREGHPVFFVGNAVDITESRRAQEERERLQAQLTQAQKMESVGRLAGGVAHDFNNMLGVILGHTEMALLQVGDGGPIQRRFQQIQETARRSADLVRQLLAFARRQTVAPQVLDLNETVEGIIEMLRRLIGEDIALTWEPGRDLWPVRMDPSQIDQVLANLCVNARDAIAGVGRISIETKNMALDGAFCAEHPEVSPGPYVLLAVRDSGCGMSEEVLEHAFEPFFTTKEVGKGTGLGLATVYGIVRQNQGVVHVESGPGLGTTFRIYLPAHRGESGEAETQTPAGAPPQGGRETVLLVEDEPVVLEMVRDMLKTLGYRVLPSATPAEAIAKAETWDDRIHLLITDVVMPGMNGLELMRRLRPLMPGLRTLFISGYPAEVISRHGEIEVGIHLLQKPFSLKEVAEKVRKALGG